ncbi:hypothetical protein BW13_10400 [Bifidobacterium sp. UTCIF-37]|uniref:DUF4268 domain-containing protein n=1 Tax=unclassified Bifidobacterium TaxID=2608897 RepID=UPI00112E537E|nr:MULTISPECIES: DUF4268 domain-containing protein [unclassified Bifidobacterium]TPF85537.1 hypothetical protein BW13_10400 [Bifidobacterium sp. UTCIF-37]TPF87588.1 hypothetical protein BW11_10615 [Bifidobacterium sp. UTCIF-38]
MNAEAIQLTKLITGTGMRFVIPVYQRPYSWEEEQCAQLWEDVLTVGRAAEQDPDHAHKHFIGSIVWIQDGVMRASGITPALIIDGQQRVTTLTLMLVALAEYAHRHSDDENLDFSYEEIIDDSYLVNKHKKGDDHYRLTLSQGDRGILRSIIDHLEGRNDSIDDEDHRLIGNLNWFRERLANISDPNAVWHGLQCLWVVSISLTQGQDDPQLIFESMNSTGKDLSTADLVRNYVLMGQRQDEQADLYEHHWRKIEEALGVDSYDRIFDDFLHDWLSMLFAPSKLVSGDVYRVFKQYAEGNGYAEPDCMKKLLDSIRRYAGYYSRIAGGTESDPGLRKAFNEIADLKVSVANPLIMMMYEDYRQKLFSHDDFTSMLRTLISYVFRRMTCEMASNGLNTFFPTVIKRLNDLRESAVPSEFNYREAFEATLLGESGRLRMPSDEEFRTALTERDCYYRFRARYLLSSLENFHHPKDPIDFGTGVYTIEHIMPQNALAHTEWCDMLDNPSEEEFNAHVSRLGNLTLTAYNSELKDATFEQKKKRAIGGYNNDYLTISAELRRIDRWDFNTIAQRGERLAKDALAIWPRPFLPADIIARYRNETTQVKSLRTKKVTLSTLCRAGLLNPGDELTSQSSKYPAKAIITSKFTIRLDSDGSDNDTSASPSDAAVRVLKRAGSPRTTANGWTFWIHENKTLADIRNEYLDSDASEEQSSDFRADFWDGFFNHCSERDDFAEIYGDQSDRSRNTGNWASFGVGQIKYHPEALLSRRHGTVGVKLYFKNAQDIYNKLLIHREKVEAMMDPLDGVITWDDADNDKKSRQVTVTRKADFDAEHRDELYSWMEDALLVMQKLVAFVE